MSIKRRAHEAYRSVKYSKKWQTSRVLNAVHPAFRLSTALMIFGFKYVYKPIKRSSPARAARSLKHKAVKQVRSQDLTSNTYKLARAQARLKHWRAAHRLYTIALARERKRKQRSEYINEAVFNLSVLNRLINIRAYREQVTKHAKRKKPARIAVYTAISGDYDTIKLPAELLPDADYFLFTDRPAPDTGVFKIRPLPYYHIDPTRMTRYAKTHPHHLLPGYDLAIWIDANILINGDIAPLIEAFKKSKLPVGAVQHPLRNTIDEEAEACIRYNKEDTAGIREQVAHYDRLNFKTKELIESNIMMFDLANAKVPKFLDSWWAEIDAFTRRDQLSLNYSLEKHGIKWHRIMKRPQDARNHPLFTLVPHSVRQPGVAALNAALSSKKTDPYAGPSFAKVKDEVVKAERSRQIDVVYCVHNALEDVKLCLASVAKYRKSPNLKLIIIDDGSDQPTAEFLRSYQQKYQWVKLIRNESGSGYTKAANQGMRASRGEFVILLNSDTIVTDGWSEKMAAAVFSTPGAGIAGPLSSAASHQSIPNHLGGTEQTATNDLPAKLTPDIVNKHCEEWSVAGYYPIVPLIHGFCFGIKREVIDANGYFDEESFPFGYGEENDYCFRATDAGFGMVVATNTYVYHAKSKSYTDDRRIALMKQGNARLRELRGRERITRSIRSVLSHPYLQKFRDQCYLLYQKY